MIFIALGANLPSAQFGSPKETLLASLARLSDYNIKPLSVSHWYQTAPVPLSDAPWYVNAVACVETDLSPRVLLETLLKVEREFGRVRTVANAPRLIDLDLIAHHDIIEFDEGADEDKPFCVPHPRLSERAFVLYPIQDLCPDWVHPRTGQGIAELIDLLDPNQQIERMD